MGGNSSDAGLPIIQEPRATAYEARGLHTQHTSSPENPPRLTNVKGGGVMVAYSEDECKHDLLDPQDKQAWYAEGERWEQEFVETIVPRLHMDIIINPAKTAEPWAHDLIVYGKPGDLKRQSTPFYTAGRYGMDPRFTVAFNVKDLTNYMMNYDRDFVVLFWLDWGVDLQERFGVEVEGMCGIWQTTIGAIDAMTDAPMHVYKNRGEGDEEHNATESILLDVRSFGLLYYNGYGLSLN